MSKYINNRDYIKDKVKILSHIGLKNKAAVEAYLREKTANCTSKEQMEIKCDIAARSIIMNFYDGDRTFVNKG